MMLAASPWVVVALACQAIAFLSVMSGLEGGHDLLDMALMDRFVLERVAQHLANLLLPLTPKRYEVNVRTDC